MELQELKGFIAVARNGSFSTAAEKTFRTQPAISLQIQSLENELGVKLFDRISPRKLELTEEGRKLLELASPVMDNYEALKPRFNEEIGKKLKGSIRIATHTSVMSFILPGVIKKFKKKYPECELSIINRGRKEILAMLSNGEIDLGITSLKSIPKNIDYRSFAEYKRVLICSKKHPLSQKKTITLKDLSEYPLILSPKGSNTRAIVDSVFEKNGLEYTVALEIIGRMAVKTYVEMGMGASIFNDFYLTKEDSKKFFIKDVSQYFGHAERGVLTRKDKYLPTPAKEFIDTLLKK